MEIEIQNLEDITVIPSQFKDLENPPKFVFRTPNAADIIDFQVFNDISRTANRCFLRFENKPTLKKDGNPVEYTTYAQFIGLGASDLVNEIHAECCARLLPVIMGIKEQAEKTEKKSK